MCVKLFVRRQRTYYRPNNELGICLEKYEQTPQGQATRLSNYAEYLFRAKEEQGMMYVQSCNYLFGGQQQAKNHTVRRSVDTHR